MPLCDLKQGPVMSARMCTLLSYLPACIGSSSRLLSSLCPPSEASLSPTCQLNSAARPAFACLITSISSPFQPIASAWIPSRPWPLMFRHVHKPLIVLLFPPYGSVLTLHYSCLIFLLGLIFPLQFLSSWSVWPPNYTLYSSFPTFFI